MPLHQELQTLLSKVQEDILTYCHDVPALIPEIVRNIHIPEIVDDDEKIAVLGDHDYDWSQGWPSGYEGRHDACLGDERYPIDAYGMLV